MFYLMLLVIHPRAFASPSSSSTSFLSVVVVTWFLTFGSVLLLLLWLLLLLLLQVKLLLLLLLSLIWCDCCCRLLFSNLPSSLLLICLHICFYFTTTLRITSERPSLMLLSFVAYFRKNIFVLPKFKHNSKITIVSLGKFSFITISCWIFG